jgi:hypothetical protein
MNRRNFILGLGTAATLSGAASVTGAALSNTVDATSNFQIVATNDLTVRRNSNLDTTALGANSNYSDTTVSEFNHTGAEPFPNMTVNGSADGDLGMALATGNDNSSDYNRNDSLGGTEPYNGTVAGTTEAQNLDVAPLQIENNGGSQKEVAVEYGIGSDVDSESASDSDGNVDPVDVAQLFTFKIGDQQISPPSDPGSVTLNDPYLEEDSNNNTYTLDAGETAKVGFVLNYSKRLEELIADAASGGSYTFSNNGQGDADLLDVARFGTTGNA